MSPNAFIRPLSPMQRIDLYAKMFSDAYAMLLNLQTNAHDDRCPLPMNEGIDESQPSSSLEGQVTDNAETDTSVSTYQNHKDSDAYAETLEEESVYDYDSTESNNPSLKHNTQETRIDLYAKMFSDACAMLLNLHTDARDDPCPLPMNEVIDESQPPSSSEGQITDNVETDIGVSINQNHKDSYAYAETLEEESIYDDDSTESNNPSLKPNTQETNVASGPCVYLWGPQDWLMHPSLYCKYMDRYLYMPLEVDSATSLSSPGPSYGVVNDVAPDLARIVEHIEYYFSFDNLIQDANFREHMDNEGWVPLPFVASLPEVRELTLNVKVIKEALKTSFAIEIKDGTKLIRHRHSWQRWISPKPYPAMN